MTEQWTSAEQESRQIVICYLWNGFKENTLLAASWAPKMLCDNANLQAEARRLFDHYTELARAYRVAARMLEAQETP